MASGAYRFEGFLLDHQNRQLRRGAEPLELNGRYLDALALLVREHGNLVTKDRFLEEVWRGVPVTDEALTQCIRSLRKQLGDDVARPRFIETVPKHGYRFIAPVEAAGPEVSREPAPPPDWRRAMVLGEAGMVGGGAAGVLGGLSYGFATLQPLQSGMGASSVLLVFVCLTILVGVIGGAGVGFGIGGATLVRRRLDAWIILGGAFGGVAVGAMVKLIGLDAFNLLFGRSPGDITGAQEGALLGAAVGLGVWLGARGSLTVGRSIAVTGLAAGAAGVLVSLTGGRLMGGSLDLLARQFAGSRLDLGAIGSLFGETGFGAVSQAVTAGVEGMLFGACTAGAMLLARRRLRGRDAD